MNNEISEFLNLARLPARLTGKQVAALLGFAEHDIPVLSRGSLLKPLGNPARTAGKFFAAVEVEKHAVDLNWLDRATKAVYRYWANQNQRRQSVTALPRGSERMLAV
jgi:hypothetical protein